MKYQGREPFQWWTGVVEDRNDPLFQNRVRVRIHGAHTWDKSLIATPDLPWSQVMMPTTSPSISGLGTSHHGLVEGSTVMGFYRDSRENQDAVVMGSFVGVSTPHHRIDEQIDIKGTRTFTKVQRTPTEGFTDPRRSETKDYKGTPDGPNPQHINRNYGLSLSLDKSPRRLGETTGISYPKKDYYGSSSVNELAQGDAGPSSLKDMYPIIETVTGEPKRSYVDPIYPFNHVHETESGHVLELDDTPDKERIHLYHRTGTRVEIDKDGNYVEKIVKNKYSVILGDDYVVVSGGVTVKIDGDLNMEVGGETNLTSTGNINMIAPKILMNSGRSPKNSVSSILDDIDDPLSKAKETLSTITSAVTGAIDSVTDYFTGG